MQHAVCRTDLGPSEAAEIGDVYALHHRRLMHYVINRFGPRDAEDIAQETFARAVEGMQVDRSPAELWSWLKNVARSVGVDLYRERLRCEVAEPVPGDDGRPEAIDEQTDTALIALARYDQDLVRRALDRMPSRQRRVLWLHAVERVPCPAIARQLLLGENATRQLLWRAKQRLTREFAAIGGRLGALLGPAGIWLHLRARREQRMLYRVAGDTPTPAVVGTCLASLGLVLSILAGVPLAGVTSGSGASSGAGNKVTGGVGQGRLVAVPQLPSGAAAGGASHATRASVRQANPSEPQARPPARMSAYVARDLFVPNERVVEVDVAVATPVGTVTVHDRYTNGPGQGLICWAATVVCR